MRTLEENKMVSVEAGDWTTVVACIACGAGLAAVGLCWEAFVAYSTATGGEFAKLYGEALFAVCATCLAGGGE